MSEEVAQTKRLLETAIEDIEAIYRLLPTKYEALLDSIHDRLERVLEMINLQGLGK